MQFMTDSEFADQLLLTAERNEKISRRIQSARRHIVSMMAALLLLASVIVGEMQSKEYTIVALAAFILGYGTRSVLGQLRRTRKRR